MERIEFVVRELYGRARLDMSEPWGSVRLATEILGSTCIRVVSARAIPGNAALAWRAHAPVMFVRAGLSPRQVNYAVAHELAEWNLRLLGHVSADAEELANRTAVALCVPRLAFERARQRHGDSVRTLSRCFAICQRLMALRMAECLGSSGAVSAGGPLRARSGSAALGASRTPEKPPACVLVGVVRAAGSNGADGAGANPATRRTGYVAPARDVDARNATRASGPLCAPLPPNARKSEAAPALTARSQRR